MMHALGGTALPRLLPGLRRGLGRWAARRGGRGAVARLLLLGGQGRPSGGLVAAIAQLPTHLDGAVRRTFIIFVNGHVTDSALRIYMKCTLELNDDIVLRGSLDF